MLTNSFNVLESSQLLGSWCSITNSVTDFTGVEDRDCVLGDASRINYTVVRQEKQVALCSS